MRIVKLSPPWDIWHKKIKALFENDPDIVVGDLFEPDDDYIDYAFDIEISNHEKYIALDRVLPNVKTFGNVVLSINMYDEENENATTGLDIYKKIFEGNPIVKDIKDVVDKTGSHHVFVRFQPEVVQFFDDNISDYSGNWSGLAAEIADEVFESDNRGVYFCTADKRENK